MRSEKMLRIALLLIVVGQLMGTVADSLNRTLVEMPAWRHLGAEAWAAFSRRADLGNGHVMYPLVGIGGTVLILAAAIAFRLSPRRPLSVAIPVYAAALMAICVMLDYYPGRSRHVEFASYRRRSYSAAASLRRFLSMGFDPSCFRSTAGLRGDIGTGGATFRATLEGRGAQGTGPIKGETLNATEDQRGVFLLNQGTRERGTWHGQCGSGNCSIRGAI